ncbi:MAG TPA: helix-turn-helix transcriptional regulator [Pseudonocardiaceae bacterium]|nr:helix-turn-helix transcriptional regulator [Pseudonocardiaceae bacterium]
MPDGFRAGIKLRRIARRIRGWRDAAGMKANETATRLHWSASKISKMENAAQPITPVDVLALGLIYGVEENERNRLFEEAQRAQSGGWWQEYAEDELIAITRDYLELEAEAAVLRTFKGDLIPGLLQTADYAAALARAALPAANEEIVRRRAEVRMTRQALLRGEHPLRVEAVLGEAALRMSVGGAKTMQAQLTRLVDLAREPNVAVRVIPFAVGAYPAICSPFVLLGFAEEHYEDVVYLENVDYGVLLEEPAVVETYRVNFAGVQEVALTPEESIAVIAGILEE